MERDIEKLEIGELLDLYMEESKAFAQALETGASWRKLREQRLRVQAISIQINRKYKEEKNGSVRRRDQGPPHHFNH